MNPRDKVIQSAFDLMILNGLANLSVNDMLRKLKMTKGGFYYYFKSKEELICEIIDQHVLGILWRQFEEAGTENVFGNSCLSIKEKLKVYYLMIPNPRITDDAGNTIKKYSVKNYFFMLYELIDKYPKLSEGYRKYYYENREMLKRILDEGKENGCLKREIDSENFAELMLAVRDGLFSIYMVNDENCIKSKLDASFEIIWKQLSDEVN